MAALGSPATPVYAVTSYPPHEAKWHRSEWWNPAPADPAPGLELRTMTVQDDIGNRFAAAAGVHRDRAHVAVPPAVVTGWVARVVGERPTAVLRDNVLRGCRPRELSRAYGGGPFTWKGRLVRGGSRPRYVADRPSFKSDDRARFLSPAPPPFGLKT
jgi:hypothetical protein